MECAPCTCRCLILYILWVNSKNQRLKNLLYSWSKPGSHRRDVSDSLLERLSTNILLFNDKGLRLCSWLKAVNTPGEVKVFKAELLTRENIREIQRK